jgi:signal transduction histidine kinase
MRGGETEKSALKTAFVYLLVTIALIFVSNFYIVGWEHISRLGYTFRILVSVGLALLATLVVYVVFKKELNRINRTLKEYADRKDSYQELYINFNRINRELNNNNLKLQEANKKLEELDDLKNAFLANMSHEIRTPMNSIIGFSELICIDDVDQEKKKKYVRIIKSNSQQLLKIVNDILDLSKLETNQFKIQKHYFPLNKMIDDVLIYAHELVGVSNKPIIIRFSKGLKEGDDMQFSDRARLYQVFTNLIDNAVKFTRSGNIDLGYNVHDGNTVTFYVKDTGKGISEHMHDHIFERFRQEQESTNRRFGGTGLGLPISRGIVELLGGKLWLQSKPGKGSTFFFSIPLETTKSEKKTEV